MIILPWSDDIVERVARERVSGDCTGIGRDFIADLVLGSPEPGKADHARMQRADMKRAAVDAEVGGLAAPHEFLEHQHDIVDARGIVQQPGVDVLKRLLRGRAGGPAAGAVDQVHMVGIGARAGSSTVLVMRAPDVCHALLSRACQPQSSI